MIKRDVFVGKGCIICKQDSKQVSVKTEIVDENDEQERA
jgi:hypothetical protein